MNKLAFWNNKDPNTMREKFFDSPYYKQKDDAHKEKCKREDYIDQTIAEAIEQCSSTAAEKTSEYLFNNADSQHEQEPIPLDNGIATVKFPVDCLPPVLRDYVLAVSEHTQTAIDMPAVASIGAMSVCLQEKVLVEGKPGWQEPVNLFCNIIAKPAERKSAVLTAIAEPIYEFERRYNEEHSMEIKHSRDTRTVLENRLKKAIEKASNPKSPSLAEVEQAREELSQHEEVKELRLTCGDVTPEALTSLMNDNNGRMAMISAEGGIFNVLAGLYQQGGANLDNVLKAHNREPIQNDRIGRKRENIQNPALTMLLMAQPTVLHDIMSNPVFRGKGLTARFLYCYPSSTVGKRRMNTNSITEAVSEAYSKVVNELLNWNPKQPTIISLSTEAQALHDDFFYELEPRLGKEGDLEDMADWSGKLHGAVLRIAGLLHMTEHHEAVEAVELFEDTISGTTMSNAIEIGKYFLAHAQVCYGAQQDIGDAKRLLERLESKAPDINGAISVRDLLRKCKNKRFNSVNDLLPSIEMLSDHGYLIQTNEDSHTGGRPKGARYILNPKHFRKCS